MGNLLTAVPQSWWIGFYVLNVAFALWNIFHYHQLRSSTKRLQELIAETEGVRDKMSRAVEVLTDVKSRRQFDMAIGPGKYDSEATLVRERTRARGVLLMVVGGDRGNGFAMQATAPEIIVATPTLLEATAREIRGTADNDIKPFLAEVDEVIRNAQAGVDMCREAGDVAALHAGERTLSVLKRLRDLVK